MAGNVFNRIVFVASAAQQGIDLQLDGEFALHAGLEPQTWSAKIPYTEFDKLDLTHTYGRVGTLQFWFSKSGQGAGGAKPDYQLQSVIVAEAEGLTIGRPQAGGAVRFIEYRLVLADFRSSFVSPRGGNLQLGLVNDKKLEDGDCFKNSELIAYCLDRMGVSANIPPEVDGFPPFRDLKWMGNHAPSELKKILDGIGCVFCPQSDGTVALYMAGKGPAPKTPFGSTTLSMPNIDRRGKALVITSAPHAIVNTLTITGPSASAQNTWIFVAEDPHDLGVLHDIHIMTDLAPDPIGHVQDNFQRQPEKRRETYRQQCYRIIQLDPDFYPSSILRVLKHDRGNGSSVDTALEVTAKIARFDPAANGWRNTSEPVTIKVHGILAGNALWLDERLLKLDTDELVNDQEADAHLVELGPDELSVRLSQEVYAPGPPKGDLVPRYFQVALAQTEAGISQVGNDADGNVANFEADPETIILRRPEWRLFQLDGNDVNRADLEAKAALIAPHYIAGSGDPGKVIVCPGFVAGEISGVCSSIQIKQKPAETTFKLNTWSYPAEFYFEKLTEKEEKHAGAAGGLAYPRQGDVIADKLSEGMTANVQSSSPVHYAVSTRAAAEKRYYGKLATNWMPGATFVELTPCKNYNDPTATGAANVHAFIFGNFSSPVAPAMLSLAVGDIVAFIVIDSTADPFICLLLAAPIFPPGTADFQGPQMQGGVSVWDFLTAH